MASNYAVYLLVLSKLKFAENTYGQRFISFCMAWKPELSHSGS